MSIHDPADSPFNHLLGFKLVEWREDYAVLELAIEPKHLNRSGVLHGGVLATLIDAVSGFAGCYCAVPGRVRRALTLSVTTSFAGQAKSGTVRAVGRKRAGGRSVFFATVEVVDAQNQIIALGDATCRYRSGSENPEGVPLDAKA